MLVCGKICSGKTTYSKRLATENNAVILSVDEITIALFGQRICEKHDEMVERTEKYLLKKAVEIYDVGVDVIFDWGFWQAADRQFITNHFKDKNIEIEWHYVNVCDDTWKQNLEKRNGRITSGQDNFYYIDENIAAKFDLMFEVPNRNEIDIWYENNWAKESV